MPISPAAGPVRRRRLRHTPRPGVPVYGRPGVFIAGVLIASQRSNQVSFQQQLDLSSQDLVIPIGESNVDETHDPLAIY